MTDLLGQDTPDFICFYCSSRKKFPIEFYFFSCFVWFGECTVTQDDRAHFICQGRLHSFFTSLCGLRKSVFSHILLIRMNRFEIIDLWENDADCMPNFYFSFLLTIQRICSSSFIYEWRKQAEAGKLNSSRKKNKVPHRFLWPSWMRSSKSFSV